MANVKREDYLSRTATEIEAAVRAGLMTRKQAEEMWQQIQMEARSIPPKTKKNPRLSIDELVRRIASERVLLEYAKRKWCFGAVHSARRTLRRLHKSLMRWGITPRVTEAPPYNPGDITLVQCGRFWRLATVLADGSLYRLNISYPLLRPEWALEEAQDFIDP